MARTQNIFDNKKIHAKKTAKANTQPLFSRHKHLFQRNTKYLIARPERKAKKNKAKKIRT